MYRMTIFNFGIKNFSFSFVFKKKMTTHSKPKNATSPAPSPAPHRARPIHSKEEKDFLLQIESPIGTGTRSPKTAGSFSEMRRHRDGVQNGWAAMPTPTTAWSDNDVFKVHVCMYV